MNRSDRMTGILIVLQGGSRTAAALAARFEVTRRTILRDIQALTELGVPIVSTPGRNGGISVLDGYWMRPLRLSEEEATVILLALDHLGDDSGSPMGSPHGTVREKIRSTMEPSIQSCADENLNGIRIARDHTVPSPAAVARLRAAITNRQWCEIAYDGKSGASERRILPELVYVKSGRWYVRAIDAKHQERRVFRIDRVTALHHAQPPADGEAIISQATRQTRSYHDPSNPLLKSSLTERGVRLALDHPDLHASLVRTADGCGELMFHCPTSELPYYGQELLGFGTDAHVLSPPELIAWIRAQLSGLTAIYGPD